MSSRSRPSLVLAADTVRSHRWGILAWVVGGAVAMYVIAVGFTNEVARIAGGAKAVAASLAPGVEAMRLLRWPAERLDTLGGYLTYHNLTVWALAITLYGAVQGARAIRGTEARGSMEEVLATGRPRVSVVRGRAVGFVATIAVVSVGLGISLAASMAAGGEPDVGGSFITAAVIGLCALAGYALGVLVSQLTPSPGAGTAVSALLVAGLYLLTNVWQKLGPVGGLRFVSPFYYFNFSRALVPGHGFDVGASATLAGLTVLMLVVAAWIFQRRDYATGLWTRKPRPSKGSPRVQRPALHTVWGATLLRQRLGLVVWCASTAVTLAVMAWLEPAFADLWDQMRMYQAIVGTAPDHTVAAQYLSFAGQLVVPVIAAYVITQAAGWVEDLRQGRAEMILAAPCSWPALIGQRLLAVLVGSAAITAAAIAGVAVGATAVGADLSPLGLARMAADSLLFAAALGAVAAFAVAWLRSAAAITALSILLGASYVIVYLVPLFEWPDWTMRLSLLGAYGSPYLEVPAVGGIAFLVGVAGLGALSAVALARRSPKVR